MNVLIILLQLLPWIRIFPAPSFFYAKEVNIDKNSLRAITIDNTYELYIKSVCKVDSNGLLVPCNCKELDTYSEEMVVENEYLFLSKMTGKAVVINYIKDREQQFYVNPDLKQQMSLLSSDSVRVNIWYINQMRFGFYDPVKSELIFQRMVKPRERHIWKLDEGKPGIITVESVKVAVVDGFEEKTTRASLELIPTFYKVPAYKLVFQKPYTPGKKETPEFDLPGNTVHVDTLCNNTYYFLRKKVGRGFDTIRFKSNRLYSYYPTQR